MRYSCKYQNKSFAFQESKGSVHFSFSSSHQIRAGVPLRLHPAARPPLGRLALAGLAVRQEDALLPHHGTRGEKERAAARGDGGAEGEAAAEGEGERQTESLTQGGGRSRWRGAPSPA